MKGLFDAQGGLRVGVVVMLAVASSCAPLIAVDFTVNSFADREDAVPGDGTCAAAGIGKCTLRAAVQEANALGGPDRILLPPGHFTLSIAGSGEDGAASGDLDVTDGGLTIQGAGADQTIVDANGIDRAFHVFEAGLSATLNLEMLTVTGGSALDPAGFPAGVGGGILADDGGLLQLSFVRVTGNEALAGGGVGGWRHDGLAMLHSEISHNEARMAPGTPSLGGGVYFDNPGGEGASIEHSTVSSNGCLTETLSECFGGVAAGECGEPFSNRLALFNSTVSGNEGHGVSIIHCNGSVTHATVYGNSGSGLVVTDSVSPTHTVVLFNSVLAHNTVQDCSLIGGIWSPQGGNLSSDSSCSLPLPGSLVGTDPELYPLGYYRPTPPAIGLTHHPRWGAAVVDFITTAGALDDQEEFPRWQDGDQDGVAADDLGSIEAAPCGVMVDPVISSITLTTGTQAACNTLTADPDVFINGAVVFEARDSVILGEGFEVTAGSGFSMLLIRDAGAP